MVIVWFHCLSVKEGCWSPVGWPVLVCTAGRDKMDGSAQLCSLLYTTGQWQFTVVYSLSYTTGQTVVDSRNGAEHDTQG